MVYIVYMLIGIHVSAAKSLALAPQRAKELGAEVFQFFSRSPRGGPAPKITPQLASEFKTNCKKCGQVESYIHTPYYINLASTKNSIYYGSISVIRDELERGSQLGVKYVMTHLGSSREIGKAEGLKLVIEGLKKVLKDYRGSTKLLVEISAGAGEVIGDTFEEIAEILKGVGDKDLGVCFDTAHAFASGYDLRTTEAVDRTIKNFDKIIGLAKLQLIHCNDSKALFNSHKDRHQHIGQGEIGLSGFKALIAHPKLQSLNFCLETPEDEQGNDKENIKILKRIRANAKSKTKNAKV